MEKLKFREVKFLARGYHCQRAVESGFIHPFADPSIPPQCRVSARRTVGPQAVAAGWQGKNRDGMCAEHEGGRARGSWEHRWGRGGAAVQVETAE